MTRKDFKVVAQIVALASRGYIGECEKRADKIDSILRGTNPNYNSSKFWEAVRKYRI